SDPIAIIAKAFITFRHPPRRKPRRTLLGVDQLQQRSVEIIWGLFPSVLASCVVNENGNLFRLLDSLVQSEITRCDEGSLHGSLGEPSLAVRTSELISHLAGMFVHGGVPKHDFATALRTEEDV